MHSATKFQDALMSEKVLEKSENCTFKSLGELYDNLCMQKRLSSVKCTHKVKKCKIGEISEK